MRRLGIGILGAIGGVFLALIVQDLLASNLPSGPTTATGLGNVIGLLMPVLAILGAVIAVRAHTGGTPPNGADDEGA